MSAPKGSQVLGLLTGAAFGALLQAGGLGRSEVIKAQLRGEDWTVVQTMGTAVAVGALGNEMLRRRGVVAPDVKPLKLGGVLSGAVVFGAGMALGGYCPGTGVTGLAGGRRDAAWSVLGMAAGALAFVKAFPTLKPLLDAGDLGKLRLQLRP